MKSLENEGTDVAIKIKNKIMKYIYYDKFVYPIINWKHYIATILSILISFNRGKLLKW